MTRLEGDEAILFRAEPALRRRLRGNFKIWEPAPTNPRQLYASGRDIHRLVRQGALKFGNRARTFVVPTSVPGRPS